MILDNVVAPEDRASFSERTITEIEKELVYWKAAKTVRVVRSRKEAPRFFPVPIVLFRRQVCNLVTNKLGNFTVL